MFAQVRPWAKNNMRIARDTLAMLLRALPAEGTHLNVFSFGTQCDARWQRSVPYDEMTLRAAVSGSVAGSSCTVC